jgi:hypothetical protein
VILIARRVFLIGVTSGIVTSMPGLALPGITAAARPPKKKPGWQFGLTHGFR